MEFCCSSSFGATNSTVRYNISQNDGGLNTNFGTLGGVKTSGTTQTYNNTVYMGPGDNGNITGGTASGANLLFDNNIIVDHRLGLAGRPGGTGLECGGVMAVRLVGCGPVPSLSGQKAPDSVGLGVTPLPL